jgi:PPK2 family polyphosphate:nucleotide phosphotransferase
MDVKKYFVKPGVKADLRTLLTDAKNGWSKEEAKKRTAKNLERIAELQQVLFAEQKRGLLIILQAMDTGGKDGTVKTIGGAMNPAGVRVVSFKKPTQEELDNGFMWRIEKNAPKKGEVVIFNRSQYEDVGVVRVHNLVPPAEWGKRFDIINDWERKISQPGPEIPEGTHILKFFLNISKEEQLERLKERLDNPDKHWKVNEGDFKERAFWNDYMTAYSDAISKCSTAEAPWIVVPADRKWMRDLVISQVVVEYLEGLNMKYPAAEADVEAIRKKYLAEEKAAAFNASSGKKKKDAAPQKKAKKGRDCKPA